jgi:uncharacterized cupin superfamily protein
MDDSNMANPLAIAADGAPARPKGATNYPPQFAARVAGRLKRPLGDHFGLKNFGVNLTRLDPGAMSALMHRHTVQDEFVYVLEGELTLITPDGETVLTAGMCAGFPAGGVAHHLVNRSSRPATYLEIGDRIPGDGADYPADDLKAEMVASQWRFTRKDGSSY